MLYKFNIFPILKIILLRISCIQCVQLCLRKNQAQQFKEYNGLIDFVNKKIELNGIVNYLRYSFKENQLISLLSDFVYRGKDVNDKVNTIASY